MALLSHRLDHAVGLLGFGRLSPLTVAVTLIVSLVIIVAVRMSLCHWERQLFKEMMNPVGRRGREKKNKQGNDPDGTTRT